MADAAASKAAEATHVGSTPTFPTTFYVLSTDHPQKRAYWSQIGHRDPEMLLSWFNGLVHSLSRGNPFGVSEPGWIALSAAATAFAAFASVVAASVTAVMAGFTFQLGVDTARVADKTGDLAAETKALVLASEE